MKKIRIFTVLTFCSYLIYAQTSEKCEYKNIYSICFEKFINFNDSSEYSFYKYIDKNCVIDTTELITYLINPNNKEGQFGNRVPSEVINSSFAFNTSFTRLPVYSDTSNIINTFTDTLPSSYYSGRIHKTFPISNKNITSKELFIYFIYSLYKADFQFTKVVNLTDGKCSVEVIENIDGLNTITYKIKHRCITNRGLRSIIKWNKLVSKKGLNYVRANNIDPLYYSRLKWR